MTMTMLPKSYSLSNIRRAYDRTIRESVENGKVYAYHCTDTSPYKIIKDGFVVGEGGFTEENQFELLYDNYLPTNPCFVSGDGHDVWNSDSKYVLKIDITGLELFPDFGHLLDFGAYFDEPDENGDTLFWWETKEYEMENSLLKNAPKLRAYLKEHDGYLHSENFTGEMSLEMIGTCCVDGDEITEDRIVEVNGKPLAFEANENTNGSDGNTIKLYRGIDGKFEKTDGVRDNGLIWTTDEPEYAKVYAVENNPCIIEYEVDENILSYPTLGELDDCFGFEVDGNTLIDGPDEYTLEKLLSRQYNCIKFEWEDHWIYCLLSREPIVGRRVLSAEEFDKLDIHA